MRTPFVRRFGGVVAVVVALLSSAVLATPVLAAAPPNDDPAGAILITSLAATVPSDLSEATAGPDDPTACPGDPAGMVSVWYRLDLTYPTTRWIGLHIASPATVDARIRVLDSPGGTPLSSCDSFVAWFLAHPGHTYWAVMLAAVSPGSPGPITLDLGGAAAAAAPANDLSSHAVVVSSFPFKATVDIAGATHSRDDPKPCRGPNIEQGLVNDQTLWYRIDYPYAHRHRVGIRVMGSNNAGFWVVAKPGGRQITCADDPTGDGAHTFFMAEPGHSYWIVLGKGDPAHAMSEPVTVRISATGVDDGGSTASNVPPNTATDPGDAAAATAAAARQPWAPTIPPIPLLAGIAGFAVAVRTSSWRRRPPVRSGP